MTAGRLLVGLALAGLGLCLAATLAAGTVTDLPVPFEFQYKNGTCRDCMVIDPPWCPTGLWTHIPTCAAPPPLGTGCPHCAAYCAPAAIMMIRHYRGYQGCPGSQDCVYERNKFLDGEIPNDWHIQSHGVGLLDVELRLAFVDALVQIHEFRNDDPVHPLTSWALRQLIGMDVPVLWIDRDGLPEEFMPPQVYLNMIMRGEGHAKVICGYDDGGTYCETSDDLVKVLDPWPYPVTVDPWRPLAEVVGTGPDDLFLTDRAGGLLVAESLTPDATQGSGARRLVRDPNSGDYDLLFASGGHIYFTRSQTPDVPGSWSPPVQVDQGEPPFLSCDPALAVSPRTHGYSPLHAVWAQRWSEGDPADIYYARSLDGGRTWSFPECVAATPMNDSRHPSLDVDGLGRLRVAWDETGLDWGREIFFSMRSPNVAGWSAPLNISRTPMMDSSHPSLATSYDYTEWDDPPGPAKLVHVAWSEELWNPQYRTVVYRSWLPGLDWTPPLGQLPEDVTGGLGGSSPSLVAGPDRVPRLVWTSSQEDPDAVPTGSAEVLYNRRESGLWGHPTVVTQPSTIESAGICPTLAFANGPFCMCLHVTWEQWRAAAASCDLYVALSRDLGAQWGDHTRVTYNGIGARAFPVLAYKDGVGFSKGYDLAWTEPSSHFGYDVRFLGISTATAPSAVEPVAGIAAAELTAGPNPFRDQLTLTASDLLRGSRLRVVDLHGRVVRLLDPQGSRPRWSWDGRDQTGRSAPQGVYFVRAPGGSARRVVLIR